MQFVLYRLGQVNSAINQFREEIFKSKEVIRENKTLLQDAFVYVRKLRSVFHAEWQLKRMEEELATTLHIYDTLVKAISYSRSGIEKTPLKDPPTLASNIRSIFELTLEVFRFERSGHPILKKYAVYCLNVMEFLEGG